MKALRTFTFSILTLGLTLPGTLLMADEDSCEKKFVVEYEIGKAHTLRVDVCNGLPITKYVVEQHTYTLDVKEVDTSLLWIIPWSYTDIITGQFETGLKYSVSVNLKQNEVFMTQNAQLTRLDKIVRNGDIETPQLSKETYKKQGKVLLNEWYTATLGNLDTRYRVREYEE